MCWSKLEIVTDDDISIQAPDDVDWALTLRMRADWDAIIVDCARSKHIDPRRDVGGRYLISSHAPKTPVAPAAAG